MLESSDLHQRRWHTVRFSKAPTSRTQGHVTSRDRPWPGQILKLTFFGQHVWIFVRVSTRGTRCCQNYVSSFLFQKLITKSHFLPKSTILTFLDLYSLTRWIKVNSDGMLAKDLQKSCGVFFSRLPTYNSLRLWHISEEIWHSAKFRPLVTSGDLNMDLNEKMTTYFRKYLLIESYRTFYSAAYYPS